MKKNITFIIIIKRLQDTTPYKCEISLNYFITIRLSKYNKFRLSNYKLCNKTNAKITEN